MQKGEAVPMSDLKAVIKYPLTTEKSVRVMEADNKLIFIVELKSTKHDIKRAVEEMFKVKVVNVNTAIMPSGEKKAFVTLSPDTPAIDVATKLGLI